MAKKFKVGDQRELEFGSRDVCGKKIVKVHKQSRQL